MDEAVNQLDQGPGARWVGYFALTVVYLAVGYAVSRGTRFNDIFRARPPPAFAPPGAGFAAVWPILYILAGYSICRVVQRSVTIGPPWSEPPSWPYWMAFFTAALHLALSNVWISMYAKERFYHACFVLLALILAVALQLYSSALTDRVAGLLLVPMLVWLCYALLMNTAMTGARSE